MRIAAALTVLLLASLALGRATTFEVGPGKACPTIGSVPWESLQPGDTVLIHWRATPYNEKWVICRQGTAAAPIAIKGVPSSSGELPIVDGNQATTRAELNYWGQNRGILKIGGANNPPDIIPQHIVVENLDIRGARPPYTFKAANGTTQTFAQNAAAIYVEKAEHLIVRNCILHDSGHAIFVSSNDSSASRDILVEGNHIHDNGIENSIYQHNSYTAAIGITFQFNRFGPPRRNCHGNNIKDRSAGLVVRYNWIEGGSRELDLVDGQDSVLIRNDPSYRATHVYGNVLIEPDGARNAQILQYGGDSGVTANYRKGTLFFYNNTVISRRTDRTTLFKLSTNDERCDARNNVFFATAAGNRVALLDSAGVLDLTANWLKPGYVAMFGFSTGIINDRGANITGAVPGFADAAAQDYRLTASSPCINAGAPLNPSVLPAGDVLFQYTKHQRGGQRPRDGKLDIGAFEMDAAKQNALPAVSVAKPSDQAE